MYQSSGTKQSTATGLLLGVFNPLFLCLNLILSRLSFNSQETCPKMPTYQFPPKVLRLRESFVNQKYVNSHFLTFYVHFGKMLLENPWKLGFFFFLARIFHPFLPKIWQFHPNRNYFCIGNSSESCTTLSLNLTS